MSFLPGSSWHQAALVSGSGGFGPPSTGCQQQQQQQQPADGLSGASTPAVLASAQMAAASAAADLHARHHSQGQLPPAGVSDPAKEEESKISFLKDEARSVGGAAEGSGSASGQQETATFLMPFLKIEDKASGGGRQREDGHGAGAASLGSAGQSPSSPLSSISSPSTSLSSAPMVERSSLNAVPDQKSHSDLDFAQHKVQDTRLDTEVGIQTSPVSTGTGESSTSGTRGGPAGELIGRRTSRDSGMEQESSRAASGAGAPALAPAAVLPRDLGAAEDETAALRAAVNTKKQTSQSSELAPRSAVRRTMSECSHLAVPTLVAAAYPTAVGGSPVTPNLPDFALMGAIGPPRAPYPHVAVRRSLTVTDGAGAAAVLATAMPSSFMTSPLLPSSPPPKRHPGSCETNFLLPVPPHAGTSGSQEIENGKREFTVGVVLGMKTREVKERFPFFDQKGCGHPRIGPRRQKEGVVCSIPFMAFSMCLCSPREPGSTWVLCPTRQKMLLAGRWGAQVKVVYLQDRKPGWTPALEDWICPPLL